MNDPRISVPARPQPDMAQLDPDDAEHIERTYRRVRAREAAKARLSEGPTLLDRLLWPVKAVCVAIANVGERVERAIRRGL